MTTIREKVGAWLESDWVRITIQRVILLNAVILGLETSQFLYSRVGTLLEFLDAACLAVFVVELVAKIYVARLNFFRNGWDLFDFFVVGVSLVPAGENVSVLRTLRVLRLLRVISIAPRLRMVVEGFVQALPGLGSVFLLMGIIYYVGAVIATQLFGSAFPHLFGTLGISAFSLFQVMTLEAWPDIAREVMTVYPNAWLFFVLFILSTTFMALNLLVGLIVNSMEDAHQEARMEKTDAYQEEALIALKDIQARLEKLENR